MGKDFCLFVSLAFLWFGLLCHISPLKVSSWHPTPVLTLRTDHIACTSASSLHLLPAGRHECVSRFSACNCHLVQILSFFSFFGLCFPLRFQNSLLTCLWEGFLLCENISSFTTPYPGWISVLKFFVSLLSLSFVLPHFEEIGLPF